MTHDRMHRPLTPLALVKLPKPVGEMTDTERHAFARQVFEAIAAARKPVAIPAG